MVSVLIEADLLIGKLPASNSWSRRSVGCAASEGTSQQAQVFRYRAQRQYRQEGETPHQQHGDDQQGDEERAADGEVPLASLLARGAGQLAGDGQYRNDVAEAAEQHGQPDGDALPAVGGGKAGEGGAVVAGGRGVGIDQS